jgi:hypothetical protein
MTPETVIEKLKSVGYQIRTDGKDIILTSDRDPINAELVTNLLKELRKYKAEAVNILRMGNVTPTEKKQPGENVKASWPPEMQSLIEWFIKLEPPAAPFNQEPHIHVIDPAKYFSSLKQEIESGPNCPRGRNGALLCDLEALRKILH